MKNLKELSEDSEFNDFFTSIEEISSKSEILLKKLREIKEDSDVKLDYQTIDDLDW